MSDKAATNGPHVYSVQRSESMRVCGEARKSSCHLLFSSFKSKETETQTASMTIVFFVPSTDVASLVDGLNGRWGLRSQEEANL